MMLAYMAVKLDVVEFLLSREGIAINQQDIDGLTPLCLAAKRGHTAIVELLLAADDVDPNVGDESSLTPLYWACKMGRVFIVRQLLAQDVNLEATHDSQVACRRCH